MPPHHPTIPYHQNSFVIFVHSQVLQAARKKSFRGLGLPQAYITTAFLAHQAWRRLKTLCEAQNYEEKKLLSSYSGENVAQHWSIMQSSVVPSHLSWAALRPHCAVSFALLLTFWLWRNLAGAHWPKDATTDTNLTLERFQWSQKMFFFFSK